MIRSVVGVTLLLVVGVVLLLGVGVVTWITAEDRESARADARAQQEAAEQELRDLASDLVDEAQDIAESLVEGGDGRLRAWMKQQPIGIHRDRVDQTPDLEALRAALIKEITLRGKREQDHVAILTRFMQEETERRIEEVAARLRQAAADQAEATTNTRRDRLVLRLAALLGGMALLLAGTLYLLVLAPVRRLRGAVDRIARGDLETPVRGGRRPTREMAALTADVDRMREQIRVATQGLESEVARKTRRLAATLEERTRAFEELKAAQEQLVQAEKMAGLGTLAGGVAHEFNNLLGGILGCLESARKGTDDAEVLDDLDMASRTARRAADLVRALLGVARPAKGRFDLVRLEGVVDDVLRTAEVAVKRSGVSLTREIEDGVVVTGDEGQLHQVVLNLVTNALQAVDDGERVVVRLATEDGRPLVEVRDSGRGVALEDRGRVFEPFFTRRAEGTGLGLFVSYGIVERHGGRIEVSDAPEGGARFTVRFPRPRPEHVEAEAAAEEGDAPEV